MKLMTIVATLTLCLAGCSGSGTMRRTVSVPIQPSDAPARFAAVCQHLEAEGFELAKHGYGTVFVPGEFARYHKVRNGAITFPEVEVRCTTRAETGESVLVFDVIDYRESRLDGCVAKLRTWSQ
ncbi:MAG: hypothetical protein JXL80_06635 [Planctomycetes bacterium]|nr:hypothetical protein [Planctomycetota bacterium]